MDKTKLIHHLNAIEDQIKRPRWMRVLSKMPLHLNWFLTGLGVFPKEKQKTSFFGSTLHFPYPASKDIFIWQAKSHDSEIRLAKFMISALSPGDTFVDVGTHIGYFTQLGAQLVGETGSVVSLEASPSSFQYLKKNTMTTDHVQVHNKAVAHKEGVMTFQEYGPQYSEFNSLVEDAPVNHLKPSKVEVETTTLDIVLSNQKVKLIKIDVEGAEDLVIKGMKAVLERGTVIAIEFLKAKNDAHKSAAQSLLEAGYSPYRIDENGALEALQDLETYIESLPFESDNIIFKKSYTS